MTQAFCDILSSSMSSDSPLLHIQISAETPNIPPSPKFACTTNEENSVALGVEVMLFVALELAYYFPLHQDSIPTRPFSRYPTP